MGLRGGALVVVLSIIVGAGFVTQSQRAAARDDTPAPAAEVTVRNVEGAQIGTVTLTPEDSKVRVEASLGELGPGFHGFHIHETGVCDPEAPDGPFTSAGGHYLGDGGQHGDHAGDLPSLYVAEDGTAELSVLTDAFTVDELRRGDGSAVMVHAGRDNFANIPDRYTSSLSGQPGPDEQTLATGDAGDRVACGVLAGDPGVEEGAGLVTVPSDVSVKTTVRRIRRDIRRADLNLVAVVNHSAAARRAGMRLPATVLIVFGNPAVGTPLMQEARTVAIDLPQKLLVWRDANGQTQVTYNDPHYLAARHGITGQDERIDAIAEVLRRLATGSG